MKILLVHHEIPYPFRSGWDRVTYNLIRMLQTIHEVTLIAPVFEDTDPAAVEHMAGVCNHLVVVPVRSKPKGWLAARMTTLRFLLPLIINRIPLNVSLNWYPQLARAIEEYCRDHKMDVVQAASIFTYGYLRFARGAACQVLGPMDDGIESSQSSKQHQLLWHKKLIVTLEWRAYCHYEVNACRRSDWVLFYSERDLKRALTRTPDLTHARHCPVATENDPLSWEEVLQSFPQQDPNAILFVGGLSPFSNQEAVLYFCQAIYPRVLAQMPQSKFYIVGHNPPAHIQALAKNDHIIVTGGVSRAELVAFIQKAAVYVGPLRAGTGVKTKIIEAMSYGKAVVATSKAVAGLFDLPKDTVMICDDPDDFAEAVVSLLRSPEQRAALGMRARRSFEQVYSFDVVLPKLARVYDEIGHSLVH